MSARRCANATWARCSSCSTSAPGSARPASALRSASARAGSAKSSTAAGASATPTSSSASPTAWTCPTTPGSCSGYPRGRSGPAQPRAAPPQPGPGQDSELLRQITAARSIDSHGYPRPPGRNRHHPAAGPSPWRTRRGGQARSPHQPRRDQPALLPAPGQPPAARRGPGRRLRPGRVAGHRHGTPAPRLGSLRTRHRRRPRSRRHLPAGLRRPGSRPTSCSTCTARKKRWPWSGPPTTRPTPPSRIRYAAGCAPPKPRWPPPPDRNPPAAKPWTAPPAKSATAPAATTSPTSPSTRPTWPAGAATALSTFGDPQTADELNTALDAMDGSFTRAEAGLRCDLAAALHVRGEQDEARHHLKRARELAQVTGSARQRRRIRDLSKRIGKAA